MIGTRDIKLNAAHPEIPVDPLFAHIGSPSQVRIINVPKSIGKWAVTAVQITANYPDNTSRSVSCTLVGGCWSATLPASTAVGQSLMGLKVTASGTDESGTAVTGYVLGKGDIFILNDDSTITIGSTTYYVHLLDAQPTYPRKGDLCLIDNAWKIYNGTEWIAFGGGTGDVRHAEFADMTADLDADESSLGDVMIKVNTLITKLKGTTAAIVALLALVSFAAVDVQTAALKSLPGKTMIVTNVVGAAAASDLANKVDKTNGTSSGLVMLGTGTSAFRFDPGEARFLEFGTWNGSSFSEAFTYQFPTKNGTVAMTADIPSTYEWGSITNKPTTLSGYGIQEEADGRYLKTSGPDGGYIVWDEFGNLRASSFESDTIYGTTSMSTIDLYALEAWFNGSGLIQYDNGIFSFANTSADVQSNLKIDGSSVVTSNMLERVGTNLLSLAVRSSGSMIEAASNNVLRIAENTAGTKIADRIGLLYDATDLPNATNGTWKTALKKDVPSTYLKTATSDANSITVTKQDDTIVGLTVQYDYTLRTAANNNIHLVSGEIVNRTIGTGSLIIFLPNYVADKSVDCILRVNATVATQIGSITDEDGNELYFDWLGDDLTTSGSIKANKVRYIYFTRVGSDRFCISSQEAN